MTTTEETMTPIQVGWDGQSRPIVELKAACGCRWTPNRKARTRVCTECLSRALHAHH